MKTNIYIIWIPVTKYENMRGKCTLCTCICQSKISYCTSANHYTQSFNLWLQYLCSRLTHRDKPAIWVANIHTVDQCWAALQKSNYFSQQWVVHGITFWNLLISLQLLIQVMLSYTDNCRVNLSAVLPEVQWKVDPSFFSVRSEDTLMQDMFAWRRGTSSLAYIWLVAIQLKTTLPWTATCSKSQWLS